MSTQEEQSIMDLQIDKELNSLTEMVINVLAQHGLKVLGAILVLVVGWIIVNRIHKLLKMTLDKVNIEPSLVTFFGALTLWLLRILLLLSVVSMIGIQTTSFLALLGSAGLAVGLALQGSLSNLAGGVLILLIKPFKVGDFIESGSFVGTVDKILLFTTELTTTGNQKVVMPNGSLANSNMINYSAHDTRRMDIDVGVAYSDDIKKAKEVIMNVLIKDGRALEEPAPQVFVSALADSSVNVRMRAWYMTDIYWNVYWQMLEDIKIALDENGLNIPFPQRDVHLYQTKS